MQLTETASQNCSIQDLLGSIEFWVLIKIIQGIDIIPESLLGTVYCEGINENSH